MKRFLAIYIGTASALEKSAWNKLGEENRKQLEQAETTYKNLVKARDVAMQTARAKIESLKGAINDMRMKQAMAEIHEMSAGMITNIGGAGDTPTGSTPTSRIDVSISR